jgi:hypothetical protein
MRARKTFQKRRRKYRHGRRCSSDFVLAAVGQWQWQSHIHPSCPRACLSSHGNCWLSLWLSPVSRCHWCSQISYYEAKHKHHEYLQAFFPMATMHWAAVHCFWHHGSERASLVAWKVANLATMHWLNPEYSTAGEKVSTSTVYRREVCYTVARRNCLLQQERNLFVGRSCERCVRRLPC